MALLEIRTLSKSFRGLRAVARASFEVPEGGLVALIGPNGAGKTTAFDVITGFQRPTQGTVRHDGEPITGWRPHRIAARGLVRTFQKTSVFPGLTVRENVLTGLHLRGRVGVSAALLARGRVRAEERRLEAEADREAIFSRFRRGSRTTSSGRSTTPAGAGLGLAIVREIATVHGARVEIGDPRAGGRGCRVSLIFPPAAEQ